MQKLVRSVLEGVRNGESQNLDRRSKCCAATNSPEAAFDVHDVLQSTKRATSMSALFVSVWQMIKSI
jgi:hypothetical protein